MEKANKEYKVTYKTYFNERLKKNRFHRRLMHPLYVQLIFDRIPIIFKSYYFDLFSQTKYALCVAGEVFTPHIKEVIRKEEALIEFIIEKNRYNFSLSVFKKEYNFYCQDLLDLMEADFIHYLVTFLRDEGLPSLADSIKKSMADCKSYELVRDMKIVFNDKTYKKLIWNSFYNTPPYLSLYAFTEKRNHSSPTCFTVMDWQQPGTREEFIAFFKRNYPDQRVEDAIEEIQKRLSKN